MNSTDSVGHAASRSLPPRPNLEFLKNEAKGRLDRLREGLPDAQLAQAQFELAREYGFSSWRALKEEVDRRSGHNTEVKGELDGDWIGEVTGGTRLALHIRRGPASEVQATLDGRSFGRFGMPVDRFSFDGENVNFTWSSASPKGALSASFIGRWNKASEVLAGQWRMQGIEVPLQFSRGVFPPAPTVEGLDGIWDGQIESDGRRYRLIVRVRTDEHGTFAWCDSPDRDLYEVPVVEFQRQGNRIVMRMLTSVIEGDLNVQEGRIEGAFIRGATTLPLILTRREPGAQPPRIREPSQVELKAEVLDRYVGKYEFAPGQTIDITRKDRTLFAQNTNQPLFELAPSSEVEFFTRVMEATITFEVEKDRAVALSLERDSRRSRALRIR